MTPKTYGQYITPQVADDHFRKFIHIKERAHPSIKSALPTDVVAKRYYCGKCAPGSIPIYEELAYFFDKASIQRILDALTDNSAEGIAIFHGARDQERDENNHITDIDGRPTVMLFPFKRSGVSFKEDGEPDLEIDLDKGSEHPGTGGRGPGGDGSFEQPNPYEIPGIFREEDILPLISA